MQDCSKTYRPLRNRLNLAPHKLLQLVRALRIRRRLIVILPAIIKNQPGVADEIVRRRVQVRFVLLLHRAQVHGLFNNLVVIGDFIPIDRLRERPRGAVVLHVVEQVEELVVVGAVAGLAREFVHVRGPARGFDGGNAHGVDFVGAEFVPFFGRGVDDVGFGEGADLGGDGFFLFEQHSAYFEVADAGDHGALHDGAALVVFDVAHPAGFLQCDILCEALLFEVAYGVVVGVGEKMLDGGGGFDVVFQMGHQVRAVTFDLLV